MTITITSTTRVIEINGIPARVWEGKTDTGVTVICAVTRIAVPNGEDTSQFERELQEMQPPTIKAVQAFPMRMVV